jgi:hypothetical protein
MITRQDIIDMANEAQLDDCIWIDEPDCKPIDDLVKFTNLVQRRIFSMDSQQFRAALDAAIEAERKRYCKQLAVLHDQYALMTTPIHINRK